MITYTKTILCLLSLPSEPNPLVLPCLSSVYWATIFVLSTGFEFSGHRIEINDREDRTFSVLALGQSVGSMSYKICLQLHVTQAVLLT